MRGVTVLGEMPNLRLARLEGNGNFLTKLDGLGSLGRLLALLGIHVVENNMIGAIRSAAYALIESEHKLLGNSIRVAHRDDALVAVAVEACETVGIVRTTTTDSPKLHLGSGAARADHLGVAKHVEVALFPMRGSRH